ncbi:DUF4190 domain-containing protein [Mycobacterium sp. pV006]|uniref:DUF4190 domain-containing protein n=1 Tax=Mycobacterium sp. pV006 TaxID=3238983 RepID=UPI00351B4EB8
MGFVVPVLAIPLGHLARSQLRRTREGDDGHAIAGLVLGHIGLRGLVAFVVVFAAITQR